MNSKYENIKPRFFHGCDKCIWLGHFEKYDLWWCVSKLCPTLTSLIARWDSNGPDYRASHPPGAFYYPPKEEGWYGEILKRAKELELYDPEIAGWKRNAEYNY